MIEPAKSFDEAWEALWARDASPGGIAVAQTVLLKYMIEHKEEIDMMRGGGYFAVVQALKSRIEHLRKALSFARLVIKSGESWSTECEIIIDGALGDQ